MIQMNKVDKTQNAQKSISEEMNELMQKSKKLRIVAMVFGWAGHVTPMSRIVASLEKAGHDVVAVITNGYYRESAEKILAS